MNIRHGDAALIKIEKIPGELKAGGNVFLKAGSSGNPHSFTGGAFYPHISGDFIIGYLDAKDTRLFHAEHSPEGAAIEDGVYEVRRQVEYTPEGLRQVED